MQTLSAPRWVESLLYFTGPQRELLPFFGPQLLQMRGIGLNPLLEPSSGMTFTEAIRNGFYLLTPPKE